jgi:signal transduction histidine kinase
MINGANAARKSLSIFLIIALISTFGILVNLHSQILKVSDGSANGSVWYVSEIEREVQEFQLSLTKYMSGVETAENVNFSFDLLWSRVNGARQGDVATQLNKFGIDSSPIERTMALLRRSEAIVVNIDAAPPALVQVMFDDFGLMNEQIHTLGLNVLQFSTAEGRAWREALLKISSANILMSSIIGAVVFFLLILFWHDGVLAKRQLYEKNELLIAAETANQAKTDFLSVINHELRTPLTSINGAVLMMGNGTFGIIPNKLQRLITIAEKNCIKLVKLVSELLEFEKFSSGNINCQLEEIHLQKFLTEQVETNTPYADTFGVGLVVDPLMENLIVHGDPHRLGQVMSNLLSNSAKFSDAGDEVVVGLKKVNGRAVVSITDTGMGIPESARQYIFDRFQQVDSSNLRERGGTGLGLAIVKLIIEAHGGEIAYESIVGQGTTFRFDLSLAEL